MNSLRERLHLVEKEKIQNNVVVQGLFLENRMKELKRNVEEFLLCKKN